jgi:hypothetical protein
MYVLKRENVDTIFTEDVFKKRPTKEELYEYIIRYFDNQKSLDAAQELEDSGHASMNDMYCTQFELYMV